MKPQPARASTWQDAYTVAIREPDRLLLWKHIEVAEPLMRLRLQALPAGDAQGAAILHGLTILDLLKRYYLGFRNPSPSPQ